MQAFKQVFNMFSVVITRKQCCSVSQSNLRPIITNDIPYVVELEHRETLLTENSL